jgi:hypothetical protein
MKAKPSDPTLVFLDQDWLEGKREILQELLQAVLRLYTRAAKLSCIISRANHDLEGDELCIKTD